MERLEMKPNDKKQELLDKKKLLEQEIQKIDFELKQLDYQNSEVDIELKEIIYCSIGTDKNLHKSSKGHDSFKVFDIDNNIAKFEYCGDPVNINYFDGVARFANNPYNIQSIKKIVTVEPGVVEKKENDNWIITKPLKIKFE